MRVRGLITLIGLGLCLGVGLMSAEVRSGEMKTMTFNADDAFILPGLGAIILHVGKSLRVEMIPPKEQLPKEFQEVDLQKGDIILMFNGKRVKTAVDLRERYESLAVADSVQFGIKRGQGMRIVSFLKPDEDSIAGGKMMMVTREIGGDQESPDGVDTKIKMIGGGDGPEPILAMDAGVIFGEKDGGVEVMVVIGNAKAELTGEPLKEGDCLVSIQGAKVTTGDAFRKLYEAIEVGTEVPLVFTRDGVGHTATFVKAKPEGMMIEKSR